MRIGFLPSDFNPMILGPVVNYGRRFESDRQHLALNRRPLQNRRFRRDAFFDS